MSAFFRHDGLVKEALDALPKLTADAFKGSPIETEYKKLSPTPNEFLNFVKRVVAVQLKPYDLPTACVWTTLPKCVASKAMRFTAICDRARNPGWPFSRIRHT